MMSNPNFYIDLKNELQENEEVEIANVICKDWNVYYNLYNPENFSDPDSTVEWENNSNVYDYYENPLTDNTKVIVVCEEDPVHLDAFKNLVAHVKKAEEQLLAFFEKYTFGGGAYADGIHYKWAKTEIERLHSTTYTNQEFLKRNLCLEEIIITNVLDELLLHFHCSWDEEHGIDIVINQKLECRVEE